MACRRPPACARNLTEVPNNKSVLVPRLWWCEDTNIKDAVRNDLKELNIDLEGLLPDCSTAQQGVPLKGGEVGGAGC